ncbi:MAG: type II secretion system protein, partial [Opitutales bacterium]|nr:type II secretion system protein [Opitutales bacterium]
MFRKKSGKRGFTLIEILMVIAIIGIVASVIVGLRPGNPRGLEDARRIASAEFRVAQSRALLGG